jgi:Ribbon-helix-helix protein, copG family
MDGDHEKAFPQAPEAAMTKTRIDEDDFAALDRLARSLTAGDMRPLSKTMRKRWQAAKRGRPRKSPAAKAVPTMITVEPKLLKRIDNRARRQGLSRSQFLANAARRELSLAR